MANSKCALCLVLVLCSISFVYGQDGRAPVNLKPSESQAQPAIPIEQRVQKGVEWEILLTGIFAGIMELLVAFVIFFEVEESRKNNFLGEATERTLFEARAQIYEAYAALQAPSLEERSKLFCDQLSSNTELRRVCDQQLVMFSRLGVMLESWLSRLGQKSLLEWFPHSAIILWIILEPYVAGGPAFDLFGHRHD